MKRMAGKPFLFQFHHRRFLFGSQSVCQGGDELCTALFSPDGGALTPNSLFGLVFFSLLVPVLIICGVLAVLIKPEAQSEVTCVTSMVAALSLTLSFLVLPTAIREVIRSR